ncbi:MAG: hypothetical protein HY681_09190 [Chloroflexi bacterium]|nr:hypothetical protein [Chloroflexota bacterium]
MAHQPDGSQPLVVDLREVPSPQAPARLRQALDLLLAAAARADDQRGGDPWQQPHEESGPHTPIRDPKAPL